MTSLFIKLIAIFTMFCDHFGNAFIGHFSFFNLIGRIAFPIFAFQISEGFIHTKNVKKYFFRLFLFAIISQIPFSLYIYKFLGNSNFFESLLHLNVFFTLSFGLLSIIFYNKLINSFKANSKNSFFPIYKILSFIIVILIAYIAEMINADYGFWGVIIIFMFYLFKDNRLANTISFITLCIIKYGIQIIVYGYNFAYIMLCFFTILSIVFINLYNGKQGKKIKYLFYIFYPLHLLLLYFVI